jgi:hypothetical protein
MGRSELCARLGHGLDLLNPAAEKPDDGRVRRARSVTRLSLCAFRLLRPESHKKQPKFMEGEDLHVSS